MHHKQDIDETFKYLEDALKIADGIKDTLSYFMVNYWLGIARWYNCEFDKSLYHYEKTLEINRATNTLWGEAISKGHIGFQVYDSQGKIDLGYKTCTEAILMAEESGDILSKAVVYTCHGISCYFKGFFNEAEEHLLKAIDFCDRIRLSIWGALAHWFLGDTYYDVGEYKIPQEYYEKAISLLEHGKLVASVVYLNRLALARVELINHKHGSDLNALYSYGDRVRHKYYRSWMRRYIIDNLLNFNGQDISEAESLIKRAIETNRKYGMKWNLARDYVLYSEWFKRKDDFSKAKEKLNRSIEIFKECGADGWVKRYEEELASFS